MGLLNVFVNTNSRPMSGGKSFPNSSEEHELGNLRLTPWRHLRNVFFNRIFSSRIPIPRSELRLLSKNANTRCLNCGWKYNFHLSPRCPICHSEKAYLLSRGSFLYGIVTYLITASLCLSLIIYAFKLSFNQ